jgi:hypothetical protein
MYKGIARKQSAFLRGKMSADGASKINIQYIIVMKDTQFITGSQVFFLLFCIP